MGPVFSKVNAEAIQPYMKGEITQSVAFEKGMTPMREFMLKQTRQKDVAMFVKLSGEKRPAKPKDVKFNDFEGVLAEVKNEGWGS